MGLRHFSAVKVPENGTWIVLTVAVNNGPSIGNRCKDFEKIEIFRFQIVLTV